MSSIFDSVFGQVLAAPAWLVCLIVGLVVFAEDALFVGFVIPGETAAILGGVAASLGHVPYPAVLVVVIVAAIVGDTVGFEVGKHVGPRILQMPVLARHQARLTGAQDFLARRGGAAVFLGRWTAFFRAVMPALAGTSRMHYPTFLAWNAAGGIAWGATVVTVGYVAGNSYAQVEKWLGRGVAVVIAVVVVVALVIWQVRRHRTEEDLDTAVDTAVEERAAVDEPGALEHDAAVDEPVGAHAERAARSAAEHTREGWDHGRQ
ncbi:membrane protein [Intrasporangium oryzae NRRL B-24470]|uniref:Membrane protein n=1 Tax=Intrasporangium oryzae NRRL B-24470 TaxID=1386089 RepID=W9GHD2_9MICO|nr:DedA family protein [Intrasporangium oryzae]EWT03299.1 membrane protein [Intrasporangium oryzae NRRL B-24470]